jgi:NAD(P)-dependent dehydrogenase (short-subunit alcohol dehydrogenase family)
MAEKLLIYGATGGVGACLSRQLAAARHPLHLVARDAGRLQALAQELDATWTAADVLEPDVFARVAAEAGPALGGLVYAVGSINLKPLARLTPADLEHDFRLNAAGAALAVQAAMPALRACAERAPIVLFSSMAASLGFALHASVGMAKAAVEGLARALAAELAPSIRVNAIALSLTDTPLARGITANPRLRESVAAMHPLGRLGHPDDAAQLAGFLLSARADWITGQVFGVDGGRSTLASRSTPP